MENNKLISIIVPLYNESETAKLFFDTLCNSTAQISAEKGNIIFEIVAVNDGSTDDTLNKLAEISGVYSNVAIVSLSRNFGQEAAVFAGLSKAKGDAIIVMDCDLQDPPEYISPMVEKWQQGFDVVNARRVSRKSDTKIKRDTAGLYYNILNKLSYNVKYPHNVNNFRLVSRRVLDVVINMPEKNKFYRGLVPFAGFKSTEILVDRKKRQKGVSKYNFKAMVRLAVYGITATTTKPLNWALYFGGFFAVLGILGGIVFAALWACGISFNAAFWGILCGMSFFSGANIFFSGINGLYIGKGYEEIKGRPAFVIDKYFPSKKEDEANRQ